MPIHRSPRTAIWPVLLGSLALALPVATRAATDPVCAECHADITVNSGAHAGTACAECHVNITSTPHDQLAPEEKLDTKAICAGCHGMASKQLGKSVHAKKSCTVCHGPPHAIQATSESESRMAPVGQIKTCGKCHDEVIEGFVSSVHGQGMLKSGLTQAAPSCSNCHGSHNIQKVDDPRANVSYQKAPETCGKCHELVLKHWRDESTHGVLWSEGKTGANGQKGPVCTTCHVNLHSVSDPTSAAMRKRFPGVCGGCHEEVMKSFRDSFHGKASALGFTTVAMCADCHTAHRNLPASDPRSSVNPEHLGETCGQCHSGQTNAGFLSFDPHSDPTRPGGARNEVRWVYLFMTTLLLGVFGFFGVHDLLWLQRTFVGKLRGEFRAPHGGPGPYIRRFSRLQIWMHVTVVVSFLLLATTGLPLKFAGAWWSPQIMAVLGGPQAAGHLHRFAAIVTFGYFLVHVLVMLKHTLIDGKRELLWGPQSMMPQSKDISDLMGNVRYFLYAGPRPAYDRWAYWEKFDYFAVFWGVAIIGFSGLMLWFPGFFTRFVPGWVLNAAYITHSDEALLATGFIFLFHFFHTHLRPEAFPMDPVIFTGRMPLARFKEERPLEYQRLVDSQQLESRLVPAPDANDLRVAYVFGFTAVTVGVLCAAAIFAALWQVFSG
jgi:cytochrome b subunit of formate dehydrogenase